MRIWFNTYFPYQEDVKIGINWYRHGHSRKWKGFTVSFIFIKWAMNINYVNNWAEYDRVINRRWKGSK